MICTPCRERRHEECRGGSWCDCQHRPPPATPDERRRAERRAGRRAERRASTAAEPGVNWRRQG